MGTIAYMSPEQARGKEELDARSGFVSSLGVALYEMATGTLPFARIATAAVIFDGILHSVPASAKELNSALPLAFENILGKTLEKDPDLRCQSASELRADPKRLSRDLESSRRPAAEKSTTGLLASPRMRSSRNANPSPSFISKIKAAPKKTNIFATASPKTSSPKFPKSPNCRFFRAPKCSPSATKRSPPSKSASNSAQLTSSKVPSAVLGSRVPHHRATR